MNYIREQVGGKKNRYKEEGYNLDLTYITPRMIAMAFPGSGLQKIYRNSVDQVKQFLVKQHGSKYLIVNLSGREVDEQKLINVFNVEWEDHQAPLLQTLFIICRKISQFLYYDPQKVVAIHCNHGKGRTGTIICCYLLFCKMFKNPHLTLQYYAKKRFQTNGGDIEGFGVTQPCQIQYINYFDKILKNPKLTPRVLAIKKLSFKGKHKFDNLYFKLKSFENNHTILSTKKGQTNFICQKQSNQISYKIYEYIFFCGDVKIEVKNTAKFSSNVFATYSFNTTFIENKELVIEVSQLSPYSLRKSDLFDQNFRIQILFKQICECPNEIDFNLRCKQCKDYLITQQGRWKEVRAACSKYEKLTEMQKQEMLGFFEKKKVEQEVQVQEK